MRRHRHIRPLAVTLLAMGLAACSAGSVADPAAETGQFPAAVISSDGYQAELTRAPNGHFYTTALVNGKPVRFVVDTGATSVALSRRDAEAVGIEVTPDSFTETGQQAGGAIRIMPVMLQSVDIGNIEVAQVEAVVLDGNADLSLLGQSWLRRLNSVQIEKDRMTLR